MPSASSPLVVALLLALVVVLAAVLGASQAARRRRRGSEPVTLQAAGPLSRPAGLSRLGRYRIEREIERGAMGAVYLAEDPASGSKVALKTLALGREFEDPDDAAEAHSRF
ncbi:MAG TPA: hypothetical protein VLU41_12385, partial [Ideonella sp.]|nr:hypothetical protein [Ideonella sp.]